MKPRRGGSRKPPLPHPPGDKAPHGPWELLAPTLDGHAGSIAVLDEAGAILLVNSAWRRFADANGMALPHYGVGTNYLESCDQASGEWADEAPAAAQGIRDVLSGALDEFYLEYPCHSPEVRRWFALRVTPFTGAGARNAVVAHFDITERKQAEARILHLSEVLRSIRDVNQLAVRERDPQRLLSEACAILVRTRGYRLVWVGQPAAGSMRVVPVARAGHPLDYLDKITITWDESETGQGPTGTATRTRRTTMCHDMATDPRFALWGAPARAAGFASSASTPMLYGERLFGTLNVYADRPRAFDEEEVALLSEVAGDLAFALQSIDDEAERKRAEEALRASEERYRELVENLNDVIYRTDREGVITYVSPAVRRVLGFAPEDLIGREYTEFVCPEDIPAIRESFQDVLEGRLHPSEYRVLDSEGRVRWVRTSSRPMVEDGKVVGLQGVFADITERKLAEEALRNSEGLHAEAQRVAHIGHWELIPEIGTPRWSDEIFRIFGLDPEQGEPSFAAHQKHLFPGDWDLLSASIQKASTDGTPFDIAFRLLRPDNDIRWMHAIGRTTRDENGKVTRVFGTAQDITGLKRAEEALRQSEERLKILFEYAPDAIYLNDLEGRFVDGNRAAEDMTGSPRAELIGKTFAESGLLLPEELPRAVAGTKKIARGEPTGPDEFTLIRRDGRRVSVEIRTFPVTVGGKTLSLGIARDITERKRAEEALRESQARFLSAFEHGPVPMCLLNPQGRFLRVNAAMCRMLQYSAEELLLKTFADVTHPADLAASRQWVAVLLAGTAEIAELEKRYLRKDGQTVWGVVKASLLRDAAGAPRYFVTHIQDITERERAQEALERSRRQLRALAARANTMREDERKLLARELHDELGQTLTGLRLDVAFLAARLPSATDEAERHTMADRLRSMADAVTAAVRKVRDVSTMLRPAALDDLGLVAAIEWQAAEFQERTGIRCGLTTDVDDMDIGPDCATALFRILQEALTNVARHAGATEVEVSLRAEADALTLEVEDNGRGITDGELQATASLGLLGMHERAIAVNGKLDIAGREGKGTRVTARVPMRRETERNSSGNDQ